RNLPYAYPALMAVVSGKQNGCVFVDSPTDPKGALLCRSYDFYLAGEPTPSLQAFIKDAEKGIFESFYGYVPSPAWRNALPSDYQLIVPRRLFLWDKLAPAYTIPDGADLLPIDAAFAERIDYEFHH